MSDESVCNLDLCYIKGNEDRLSLLLTYWNEEQDDTETYVIEYDKAKKCFDDYSFLDLPENVWAEVREQEQRLLSIAEQLEVGQKFFDGELSEDAEYPLIEKEQIDLFFEQIKYVYCDCDKAHTFFSFASEYRIDDSWLVKELKNQLFMIEVVSVLWKEMFEQKKFSLEKMKVSIDSAGRGILDGMYGSIPRQKHTPYFNSKIEELFPKMVEEYEKYQKRSRLENLFKGK
ncbi:hypothetical protein [Bacillus cereus]|uniref:hypothetical protein n=1 Tax=Bacillus cereus TaxID=1396 RepID=UPI0024BD39EC|nr:hypothetical protein [Bacillus cereus]